MTTRRASHAPSLENGHSPLRLAAGHRHFDHRAAPYAAIEFGYFADEGLGEVTVEATGEDNFTLAKLDAGEIDIALDVSPAKVLTPVEGREPLVIVGSMCNGVGQVLVGRKGLERIEDLGGKRIHVVERGSGVDWHPLRIQLRAHGIDPDHDVSLVFKAPYPLWDNVRRGFDEDLADARMMLHAEAPKAIAAGYPVLFDFLAHYPADYPQRVIVTTRRFLDAHPEQLAAFLRAMVRGYRYLRDPANYQAAMAMLRRHITDPGLGFPPGITDHFLGEHYFGFRQMPHDGGVSRASFERYIEEEAGEGRLPSGLDAASVLVEEPVTAAAEAIDMRYGRGAYRATS